jgi:ribosomal protein S17E
MGRIKSLIVRKAAADLFGSVDGFGEDFGHNKKLLIDTMPSKKVRNLVAGQLTRLAKQKRIKETQSSRDVVQQQEETVEQYEREY